MGLPTSPHSMPLSYLGLGGSTQPWSYSLPRRLVGAQRQAAVGYTSPSLNVLTRLHWRENFKYTRSKLSRFIIITIFLHCDPNIYSYFCTQYLHNLMFSLAFFTHYSHNYTYFHIYTYTHIHPLIHWFIIYYPLFSYSLLHIFIHFHSSTHIYLLFTHNHIIQF